MLLLHIILKEAEHSREPVHRIMKGAQFQNVENLSFYFSFIAMGTRVSKPTGASGSILVSEKI